MSLQDDGRKVGSVMVRWSRIVRYIPFAIVLAGMLAYLNTFTNPFIFDDARTITGNRTIDELLPSVWTTRWLVDFSFRLNYALDGFNVAGYHAVNLGIHVAVALLLYGTLRRTLQLPRLRARYGAAAPWLAGTTALLFVAHPLTTAAVTYVCQRYESMMALCFLATLYAFVRAVTAPAARGRHAWAVTAVAACLLGMGTKEVMLAAPPVVLLYDWLLIGRTLPGTGRRRALWHGALFLTLAALVVMEVRMLRFMAASGHTLTGAASPWRYLATQTEVIMHYLRLSVWPAGQCLDYAWPLAAGWGAVWPSALAVAALGVLTLWGLGRRAAWAFPAGAFFLVLAPSSSLLPAPDAAFEHRMYLPLAAVLIVIVIGLYRLLNPWLARRRYAAAVWLALVVGVTGALATATHCRNRVYASSEAMWRDVMAKAPGNYRQRLSLFDALFERGNDAAAETVIRDLIADTRDAFNRMETSPVPGRDPFWHHAVARSRLGRLLLSRGDAAGAIHEIAVTVEALPGYAVGHSDMALALAALGRYPEALSAAREAVRLDPAYAHARATLASLLARTGAHAEAAVQYRAAIELSPPPCLDLTRERARLQASAPEAEPTEERPAGGREGE